MIASFSSYNGQGIQKPWDQANQGVRTLKQLDKTPGDLNKAPDAISMKTALGQLDAVVLTNPDHSQTVVQRLTKTSGEVQTTWLEIPQKGNGTPNLSGFEITRSSWMTQGLELDVKETYDPNAVGSASIFPTRTYQTLLMQQPEALQNALMRADSVLAAFPV